MIVEYIRYTIPAATREVFEAAYEPAAKVLDANPHCLGCEVARDMEETDHRVGRIEWDSPKGHEKGLRASPDFRTLLSAVQPFDPQIEEMEHCEAGRIQGVAQR